MPSAEDFITAQYGELDGEAAVIIMIPGNSAWKPDGLTQIFQVANKPLFRQAEVRHVHSFTQEILIGFMGVSPTDEALKIFIENLAVIMNVTVTPRKF